MINIQKTGNAIVIDFTDNDKYLNNGTIEVAPNELMIVIDESNMATFKKMSNGDTLFGQLIDQIQIQGENVTKDNIIEKFGIIGFSISGGGGTITIDSELSTESENPVQNKVITNAINGKQDAGDYALKSEIPDVSTLATKEELAAKLDTATYNVDKPTFALKTEIPNISGLATKTELSGKLDTATYNSEKASFETKENAAATYQVKGDYATTAQLNSKQDTLVSGTNIKTINGNSLLGEGDITIQAGGTVDTEMSDTSKNAVQNKVIKKYIDDLVGNILTQLQEINGTN